MVKVDVEGFRYECLGVLEKVESLINVGVQNGITKQYDLSSLKKDIELLQTAKDVTNFKADRGFKELKRLTRLCGRVCCEVVVEPNTIMQLVVCNTCPIFEFEKNYL
ncbi:hypothetical protein SAMN03159341_1329 [Paenibacillus sp. 1_12]|uniref:hypothetical protein n=1 Tax=Paenibacillus sp. 1_12 TaxID=1566278 RepID=UPI0008E57F3F|nr:hypothetical protein [Paenibacillus sp. 1_12]SFM41843.1 hypothetical protein SAMN03159341_1329 [Paenibacillus sp. 1_12]